MKTLTTLLVAAALALSACQGPGADTSTAPHPGDGVAIIHQASIQSYSTPYDNSGLPGHTVQAVNLAIGWIAGNNWVLYQRKSDQHCTFYQVTSGSTMSGIQLSASASLGADTVYVPWTGQNYWFYCSNFGASWEVDPPNIVANTGVTITANASHGNNTIYCGGSATVGAASFIYRSGDDPDLFNCWGYSLDVASAGGGDIIYEHTAVTSGAGGSAFRGEDGNDCVFGNGGFVDCGAGTDSAQPNTSGTYNCENAISSCL